VEFHGFHKASPIVGTELKRKWKKAFVVDITKKGIEKVFLKFVVEIGKDTFFEVVGFVGFEKGEYFGNFYCYTVFH
jgi:hypothetical protein